MLKTILIIIKFYRKMRFLKFTCEVFKPLPWFILNVTVVVTVKLFWFWLMPDLAHLGGGGGGVFIFCLAPWFSVMIFLLSANSGDVRHDRLFWWKVEMDVNFLALLVNSTVVNFGVSRLFFRLSKFLVSCLGFRILFSTL